MSTNPSQPVALVTGATSGIGAATARRLETEGYLVHAVGRRADRLASLGATIVGHRLDVQDLESLTALLDGIGPLDAVVNNAGLGRMVPLATATSADITQSIATNVTAVLQICRLTLGPMIERRSGHVVLIGSMAGTYPIPAAIYGSTKAAMHMLAKDLRMELIGTGVRVTEILPGRVSTEFYDVAIDDDEQRQGVKNSGITEVSPADCADAIAYALAVPPHVNINRIELQPTEQTYGGSSFAPVQPR